MPIKSKLLPVSISDFKNMTISIENYQRAYEWKLEDIESLFNSIINNAYFGSITFKDSGKGIFEIIDGQQRITSLAILLGGNIENSDINFKFNFTDDNIKKALNSILNNDIKKVQSAKEKIDENSYLTMIKRLKDAWNDKYSKMEQKTKEQFLLAIGKLSIPFINISDYDINNSFLKMNNSGVQLDFSSYAKATFLINGVKDEGIFLEQWNLFLTAYYKYNNDRNQRFSKDDALLQTSQYLSETFKVKLRKDKIKDISPKIFVEAKTYLNFADEILLHFKSAVPLTFIKRAKGDKKIKPSEEKAKSVIPNSDWFAFSNNVFGNFNSDMMVNSYWLYRKNLKSKKMTTDHKLKWSIFFMMNEMVSLMSGSPVKSVKTKNEIRDDFTFKEVYELSFAASYRILFKSLKEHISSNRDDIVKYWNKAIIGVNWKNDIKYSKDRVSSKISIIFTFVRDLLWSIIQKNFGCEVSLKAIISLVNGLMAGTSSKEKISYEHMLGKSQPNILFGYYLNKKINSKIPKDAPFSERILAYKKQPIIPFAKIPLRDIEKRYKGQADKELRDLIKSSYLIK